MKGVNLLQCILRQRIEFKLLLYLKEPVQVLQTLYAVFAAAFCADGTASAVTGIHADSSVDPEKRPGLDFPAAGAPGHHIGQEEKKQHNRCGGKEKKPPVHKATPLLIAIWAGSVL